MKTLDGTDDCEQEFLNQEYEKFLKLGLGNHREKDDVMKSREAEHQVYVENLDTIQYLISEGKDVHKHSPQGFYVEKKKRVISKKIADNGREHGFLLENSFSIRTQFCRGHCDAGDWKLMVIDDDEKCDDDHSRDRRQKATNIFEKTWRLPYTVTSKGRHYYVKILDCPTTTETETNVFTFFKGDLFGGRVNGNNI